MVTTDLVTAAAFYLAAMVACCVALSRLLAWVTSPQAVMLVEWLAAEVNRHG